MYLIRHRDHGTEHALKVLHDTHRQVLPRLFLERDAQASLDHPNIVRVTDTVDVGGQPGLLMECIQGPTLAELLERSR